MIISVASHKGGSSQDDDHRSPTAYFQTIGPTLLLDRLYENLAAKVDQLRSEIDITDDQDSQ